jgi:hypothetical protein
MKKWTEQSCQRKKSKWLKKHMKKCSPSLAIKEMQIKSAPRFHLTPVRTASIKNTTNNIFGEDVGGKEPSYTAGGNVS